MVGKKFKKNAYEHFTHTSWTHKLFTVQLFIKILVSRLYVKSDDYIGICIVSWTCLLMVHTKHLTMQVDDDCWCQKKLELRETKI